MTVKDNDNLALVLERINLLMQPAPVTDEPASSEEGGGDIPLLTDVYTGDQSQLAVHAEPSVRRQDQVDALLKEMRPFIRIEVKKVVLQESVKLEKMLATRLEADLINTLRERLIASD